MGEPDNMVEAGTGGIIGVEGGIIGVEGGIIGVEGGISGGDGLGGDREAAGIEGERRLGETTIGILGTTVEGTDKSNTLLVSVSISYSPINSGNKL